jgi:NitT/TauT family transport system ATP-binding protein
VTALSPRFAGVPAGNGVQEAKPIALSARSLTVRFGAAGQPRTILDDITLEVRREEIACVIGPSGCGKTTLLRALAGLQPPSSGQVEFDGARINRARRDLAVVFQDYGRALLPWRSVQQNAALALEARGIPRGEHSAIIAPLLEQVGLERYARAIFQLNCPVAYSNEFRLHDAWRLSRVRSSWTSRLARSTP